MLTPELYLEQVAEAIKNRPVSATDRWVICWTNGEIHIWPSHAMYKAEFVIWRLSEQEATKGLKSSEWQVIAGRIRKLIRNAKALRKPERSAQLSGKE